ncbi:phage tail tape measure protein [Streptomyces sp. Isolate_219]|uniref:phage tail tape measure protein n=1 Tax=Streptomyces sp. Isolate_219 TaxID=2950110 RepID=UPI0021C6ED42|nr:phage tail tape measure protein [Streptomyces sp. Isolate_219]MCR8576463.1 phage tail tape measure protein [Streptomyces sp. Isolate_219]
MPEVQGFASQLRRQVVGPAQSAGDQAGQAAGSSFGDKLKAGLAGAAVAAGALLVKGLGDAIDQANVTSKLQAQLGATGKDAGKYGKIAGKLYSSGVSETFQDAADAIKSVMQSGIAPPGATNAQLQEIATKASDVATVFGQDLGGVTNAVSQMMRTGLAKNSTEAFDIITAGFQSGANKADDLLDTVNEYGTQFRKAGLTGQAAMGLINQAIQGGARDADIAADAIKEFSIRAVDGSDTTVEGFKALGLNADTMAAKFAKGGKNAAGALDTTLDRLRSMKDPVKQSATAVALFGTQAEDLGQALFKMDPSRAAKGLGDFGGKAKQLGKTIRSGPAHELSTFARSVQQNLVEVLGKYVVPALVKVGGALNTYVKPALGVLRDALGGIASAAVGAFKWVKEYGPWFAPLGIAIGGIALAMSASTLATWGMTAAFSAYRAVILIGTAITNGFAAAQALLNAVMALNPITLIVIAIVALVAAVVVAYHKIGWFRAAVQAAWDGIKTVVSFVWNSVLKPVFTALGNVILWLWNNVVKPAFNGIVAVIKIAMIPIQVTLSVIWFAIKKLGQVAMWLWNNAIKPAFGWIADKALWLWNYGIKPGLNLIKQGLSALGSAFKWLWNNGVKPVLTWISDKAKWVWTYGIKPGIDSIKRGLTVLKNAFRWLWDNGVKPVLDWISDKAKWVWKYGIKPSFDALKSGVKKVGDSFKTAKDFIGNQWSKLQEIAKKPVRFLINTVYNGGIVPLWNKVATAFGAPSLKPLNIKGYATGGILPGYTPGRDVHLAALSGGEAIMRPEWTRAMGPGYVNAMNAAARQGGVKGVQNAMGGGLPAFKNGGIFGWIGNAASTVAGWGSSAWEKVKEGASWLKDGIKDSVINGANALVRPLINKISGSASLYRSMITGIPKKILSVITDFGGKADKRSEAAGIGGKGTKGALAWARTQNGKPYQWGGNGNPSWDCSGFMSAIESVIRGEKPHRRWSTHAFSGSTAPGGWVRGMRAPFMVGITNAGVGHTAGTLNGVNVESRGGGIHVGSSARGYRDRLFTDWYGFSGSKKYDNGGWLQPGATMAVNKTGRPEAILTAGDWSNVATLANRGASGGIQDGARLVLVTESGKSFEAYVDQRADGRIHDGLVAPAGLGRTL